MTTIPLHCPRCGSVALRADAVVLKAHRYTEVAFVCPGCAQPVSRVISNGEAGALARAGVSTTVVAADHPVDQVVAEFDERRLDDLSALMDGEDWLERLL